LAPSAVVEESPAPGGDLEIFDWDGDGPVVTVPISPDAVRLRVAWSGLLEENRFEGLDEDGNSDETLLVQVWPQKQDGPVVLRCWPPLSLPAPSDRSVDGRRQFEGLEVVMTALERLDLVYRFSHPYPGLPGSSQDHNSSYALYRDRRDGSFWADGYDIRRTLREVSESEATEMQGHHPGED
jgi:hypothetical protein